MLDNCFEIIFPYRRFDIKSLDFSDNEDEQGIKNSAKIGNHIWDKVFKNGPSKRKKSKGVFQEIYLVHSGILCSIYSLTFFILKPPTDKKVCYFTQCEIKRFYSPQHLTSKKRFGLEIHLKISEYLNYHFLFSERFNRRGSQKRHSYWTNSGW